jgi:internalin A
MEVDFVERLSMFENGTTANKELPVNDLILEARRTGSAQLNLSDESLAELPESIGQLTQLRRLTLRLPQLTTLPDSISRLHQLQTLDVSENQWTRLPEGIEHLTSLQRLNLSRNQLTTLPESIANLTSLRTIHAHYNQLTALPETIGRLKTLRQLLLSDNLLVSLPQSIGHLVQLKELLVSRNLLAVLPDAICQLTQLERLDVSSNYLTSLPERIRELSELKWLYLHGNDTLGLPPEVLGRSRQEVRHMQPGQVEPTNVRPILDYYFRVRIGRLPLNEAKLILIGRGEAGKTSIVNRLVHYTFNRNEKKTDGIRITKWKLLLPGNEDVRLNIWDFGGQEIMHATHQFFLSRRSLYLLVLNGREGGEDFDAEYWLRLIESFGGDSPVIVVLNKIKSHPFDVNRRAYHQKFPAIRDFIKTDCEDGTGFDTLRAAVERETYQLKHLRDAFPTSWFGIKDRLAGMQENYLSFEEFREICGEFGETNTGAQERLAMYLHDLGIALNYKDDPRLQDMNVLNPHWVTNGIYRILNSDKLEQQKGEIRLRDIPGILPRSEYPVSMHRFLLDLMKKFDLCFSFPGDDTHYLIPERLDKQEPEDTADFKPEECLNFQYLYPVLPEGLLPRFIVRTHGLSESFPRWHTGVILKFEDNLALVKADVQDKRVSISVSGLGPSRRRLLAIIRADFERIHGDIRNLKPREMVPLPDRPAIVVSYQELRVREKNGEKTFTMVAGDQLININVHQLLNGIDLDRNSQREGTMEETTQSLRVFCSYSHKDERLRDKLETHLKYLQRPGLIETWHDRKVGAGWEWKKRIDENIRSCHIILLLVSADFIASEYCYDREMMAALERHDKGEARVIPVIVRDVNWETAPFAKLQALPKDGRAVAKWRPRDSAWKNVAAGIEKVVEEIRRKWRKPALKGEALSDSSDKGNVWPD